MLKILEKFSKDDLMFLVDAKLENKMFELLKKYIYQEIGELKSQLVISIRTLSRDELVQLYKIDGEIRALEQLLTLPDQAAKLLKKINGSKESTTK
jgi:hypothetical protein